jgi:hypothetical protein
MRPYLITAKLMRPSDMKRFPTPVLDCTCGKLLQHRVGLAVLQRCGHKSSTSFLYLDGL